MVKNKATDPLLSLLIEYLHSEEDRVQTEEELIYEVVGRYIFELSFIGHTPDCHLDDLESLIREEAIEMYRKKTYGFHSLSEYRASLKMKCH